MSFSLDAALKKEEGVFPDVGPECVAGVGVFIFVVWVNPVTRVSDMVWRRLNLIL